MPDDIKRFPPNPVRSPLEPPTAQKGEAQTPVSGPAPVRGLGFEGSAAAEAAKAWEARRHNPGAASARQMAQTYVDAALVENPLTRFEDATLELDQSGNIVVECEGLTLFERAAAALVDVARAPGPDQPARCSWAAERLTQLLVKHNERIMDRLQLAVRTPAEQPMALAWKQWSELEVQRFHKNVPAQLGSLVQQALPRAIFESARAVATKAVAKFEALHTSKIVGDALPRLGISDNPGVADTVLWQPDGLEHLKTAALSLTRATRAMDSPGGRQIFTRAEREAFRAEHAQRLQQIAFDHDCYVAELEIAASQGLPAGSALVSSLRLVTMDLHDEVYAAGMGAEDLPALWRSWRARTEGTLRAPTHQPPGSTARN